LYCRQGDEVRPTFFHRCSLGIFFFSLFPVPPAALSASESFHLVMLITIGPFHLAYFPSSCLVSTLPVCFTVEIMGGGDFPVLRFKQWVTLVTHMWHPLELQTLGPRSPLLCGPGANSFLCSISCAGGHFTFIYPLIVRRFVRLGFHD